MPAVSSAWSIFWPSCPATAAPWCRERPYFIVIRILRLLWVFRVLKPVPFLSQVRLLTAGLPASSRQIMVFLYAVLMLAVIFGAVMNVVEGAASRFTRIPRSIHWTIVAMTTVGFGDITPQTTLSGGGRVEVRPIVDVDS